MKFNNAVLAFIAAALPTVWSLPAQLDVRQNKLPTCGAETCLTETPGLFDACEPNDLGCLCSLQQSEVTRYVGTVQPCIDGEPGKVACTDGARYQYKDLLKQVCASDQFGNKAVEFAPTA
ncbi:Nn.00g005610.m01.CDS01 [Neocucurbitaria sp. VM-36]